MSFGNWKLLKNRDSKLELPILDNYVIVIEILWP